MQEKSDEGGIVAALKSALTLGSFRTKFILVVGAAVVFDLVLSGGVSIWNMQRLSEDARGEISEGLTESTEQFLETYLLANTAQADLLIEQVHSELTVLANGMQTLIDNPEIRDELGGAMQEDSGPDHGTGVQRSRGLVAKPAGRAFRGQRLGLFAR